MFVVRVRVGRTGDGLQGGDDGVSAVASPCRNRDPRLPLSADGRSHRGARIGDK